MNSRRLLIFCFALTLIAHSGCGPLLGAKRADQSFFVLIDDGKVSFRIVLTTPACPVKEAFEKEARELVGSIEGVGDVSVIMDSEVPKGRGIANNGAVPG